MGADTQDGEFVFIYTTLPSMAAAEALGRVLVAEKLAACVNIHPGVRSVYEWEGKVAVEDEVSAFIKTRAALVDAAMARLSALHPYDVPALLVLPIIAGNTDYLEWARGQVRA